MFEMIHFQGCSSTTMLGEICFKNEKFEGNARGPYKRHFLLTPLGVATPIPLLSNLKIKQEAGGEIVSTKGDVFRPSLPNEFNLKHLDLPSS